MASLHASDPSDLSVGPALPGLFCAARREMLTHTSGHSLPGGQSAVEGVAAFVRRALAFAAAEDAADEATDPGAA